MEASKGCIFYTIGVKCLIRMLISMYTLRRHYKGPVTVITEGPQPEWFLKAMRAQQADILPITPPDQVAPLVRKAQLYKYSPYDLTMFLDADTVILKPIDAYFDKIREHGFCVGHFAGWGSDKRIIKKRITAFTELAGQPLIDTAIKLGPAVNTGIFGFRKDSPMLPDWEDLTFKGWVNNCSNIPDEIACQVLLGKHKAWIAPVDWGVSVKFGQVVDTTVVVHYHGRKHTHPFPPCALFKQAFWEYYWTRADTELRKEICNTYGDRKLKRYLKSINHNVTVVTAVDPRYLPSLKAHFPTWMRTEGICELEMICFVNGIPLDSPELDFLRSRVRLIDWVFPQAESQREQMLTAFVIGAAKEVKTKWWIKLDADVKAIQLDPKKLGFTLKWEPEHYNRVITGHRWHYSKPGSYLRQLENWADTRPELKKFPRVFTEDQLALADTQKRYGHERLASFICLHRSPFVQYAAMLCGTGRMPVPSHDTFLWYLAARMQKTYGTLNLKKQGFIP